MKLHQPDAEQEISESSSPTSDDYLVQSHNTFLNQQRQNTPSSSSLSENSTSVRKVGYCFIIFENIESVTAAASVNEHMINGYGIEAKVCDKSVSRKTTMKVGGRLIPAKVDTAKYWSCLGFEFELAC